MESFFEKLTKEQFNLTDQVLLIQKMLDLSLDSPLDSQFIGALREEIENDFFVLPNTIRNNCITFNALILKTGVIQEFRNYGGSSMNLLQDKVEYESYNGYDFIDFQNFKDYCECILTVLNYFFKENINEIKSFKHVYNRINENITSVVEKLNHEIKFMNGIVIIIEKNHEVTQAAEILDKKYDLGAALYLYHHSSLKSCLNEKSDTLCRLFKHFESIENTLRSNNFASIADQIGNLANNSGTRHKLKEKNESVMNSKKETEKEKIFDCLFSLYLTAIIIADYYDKKKADVEKYCAKFSRKKTK